MCAENGVLPVQTVVLFNGEEIKEWTFSSGVFRTTWNHAMHPNTFQTPCLAVFKMLSFRLACLRISCCRRDREIPGITALSAHSSGP